MCGIVGVAGTMQLKHEQAFRDLLVVDVIRGPDSTGIMGASSFDGVQVVKKALLPTDLFTLRATEELFHSFNYCLLGHNRWATQGAVNGVNAHPFVFDDLVGVHNGTLVNQSLLPDSKDFEVDSENVFHSIQEIGIEATYKRLHGAAALVWFEEEGRSLNFLRNKERPMYITYTTDRKTLFWASESWMLEGVLWKNNIDHTDIFTTEEDTWYNFRIPHHTDERVDGELPLVFPKVHMKKLEAYEPPKKYIPFQGTQETNGATSSMNTAHGGTDAPAYEMGEEIYFFLDPNAVQDKRYLDCSNSENFSQTVRVYCKKKSWLRINAKNRDDTLYMGIVNGFIINDQGYGVVVQENSVYQVDQEDGAANDASGGIEDDEIPFSVEEFSLESREHQTRVLNRCNSACGICGEGTRPHPRNYCLSDDAIICNGCRDTDLAQEYIKSY